MQTSIILPDRLYARLTDSAKYHGLGQSEIIRQALHRYLIELEGQIGPPADDQARPPANKSPESTLA